MTAAPGDDAPNQADRTPGSGGDAGAPPPPHGGDVLDQAAGGSPVLRRLSRDRWQLLAGLWVLLTVLTIAADGWSTSKLFYVILSVWFVACAVIELRVRRRREARRRAADGAAAPGPPVS